jgi:hypothetical protein
MDVPLSLIDSFTSPSQVDSHVRALQAETFQRRFRPLLIITHLPNQQGHILLGVING